MIFLFFKKSGFLVFLVHLETTLPDGLETSGEGRIANFGIFLEVFEFLGFVMIFFRFSKKNGFWGILGPPSYGIGATIRIGRELLCLPYAGFFHTETNIKS